MQPSEQQTGFTRATCYRITVENPRWQAMEKTRHEILWTTQIAKREENTGKVIVCILADSMQRYLSEEGLFK